MADKVDSATLDLIFREAREVPESQMRTAEALDSKTIQVFAAASVVIGLAATGGIQGHASIPVLIAAVVAYLAAVVGAFASLRVRSFRTNASPQTLWEDHWEDDAEALKLALVDDLAGSYEENDKCLREKARGFKVALAMTGVESALVAVALIVSLV